MTQKEANYSHGHHAAVLRSHKWRNAANSAAYLLPSIKPDMHILDVGCGPGTITADFAALVPQGQVIGIEPVPEILEQARQAADERGLKNIRFEVGDVYALKYADATFDVVHAHQVLQHLGDTVGALKEMKRVLKPGGIVAVRDTDFSATAWYPEVIGMEDWRKLYIRVCRANGGEPEGGRRLLSWALEAGFEQSKITCSASAWCYSTPDEIKWWSDLWAERTVASAFAKLAIENKAATMEQLEDSAAAWRRWGSHHDAWMSYLHGEVLARK